ncbi:hypothetical protein NPIL_521101 [Nephila pilipes]|uniref:Uncharacterized protein n=1 Tax=Nephila pilipes TaxID=299642 RepID=A0A8X6TIH4_NEPPI|nr:hypothetical protein NPIL_521101 [Nephila pilipes]
MHIFIHCRGVLQISIFRAPALFLIGRALSFRRLPRVFIDWRRRARADVSCWPTIRRFRQEGYTAQYYLLYPTYLYVSFFFIPPPCSFRLGVKQNFFHWGGSPARKKDLDKTVLNAVVLGRFG